MAITNYGELKTAVANWLDRDNLTLFIPDFIGLYESKFSRTMRMRQMETQATLVDASGSYVLPTDLAQIRDVWNAGVNPIVPLSPVTSDFANAVSPQSGLDAAHYYISGDRLYTVPNNGADVGLRYFAKLTPLDADEDTNWLLSAHPDAYLYGALVEALMFDMDETRAQIWQQRLNVVYQEMIQADAGTRWNHAAMRVTGPTP